MNSQNFTRWITAMESDWAQSQTLNPLEILRKLAAKDNAVNPCTWLGFNQDVPAERAVCDELIALMFCPWEDARPEMCGKAAQLREWCHGRGMRIGEVAA